MSSKLHPTAVEGSRSITRTKGISDYVTEMIEYVRTDQNSMREWLDKKSMYYDRRFGLEDQIVNFPWPGASNITIQLSDIHIGELKPPIMNLTLGSSRVYSMRPQNAESVPSASNCNLVMEGILRGGGIHSMPDYPLQQAYAVESLGQHGLAISKVYYHYETRQAVETIRRADLPARIAQFAVMADATDDMKQMAAQVGITILSPQEFDTAWKGQLEAWVLEDFDLDKEDRVDAVALATIRGYLRGGQKEKRVTIKRRAVILDTPRLVNVPIEDIVVPQGTRAIEDAERVAHRMFFSRNDLLQRARDEVWIKDAVDKIIALDNRESRGKGAVGTLPQDTLSVSKRDRHGPSAYGLPIADGLYEIWEIYCHWDIDGDGLDERVVLTVEPNNNLLLKAIELPFDHGEWPFSVAMLEATDNSFFAPRGVPEKIEQLEKHATAICRAEHNNLLIQTSQSFTYVDNRGFNPKAVNWMPGLMIPVQSHDDLRPIPMSPTALALEGPMNQMMSLSQRVVSGIDKPLIDAPEPERRTAAQVNATQSARHAILGVTGQLWQHCKKREGYLIWSLWKQYGPERWYSHVTGAAPVKMTQSMIRGEFDSVPVGAVADMDPTYRSQQAMQRLDMAMRMAPALQDDPRYETDIAQAYIDYLEETDPIASQRLVRKRSPEQIQQIVQQQQEMAAQQQQIAQLAQAALQNAPMTTENALELLKAIKAAMPWKELQQIQAESQQMNRAAIRGQGLVGQNGAG